MGDDSVAGHVLASPLAVQGERFSAAPHSPSLNNAAPSDPYANNSPPSQSPTIPSDFVPPQQGLDFNSILDTTNFEGESGSAGSSEPPANAAGSTQNAYAAGPPEAYPAVNLFPSHEWNGMENLAPPAPMVHSRSYSEQPRKGTATESAPISYSAGSSPYGAGATAEYTQGGEFGFNEER